MQNNDAGCFKLTSRWGCVGRWEEAIVSHVKEVQELISLSLLWLEQWKFSCPSVNKWRADMSAEFRSALTDEAAHRVGGFDTQSLRVYLKSNFFSHLVIASTSNTGWLVRNRFSNFRQLCSYFLLLNLIYIRYLCSHFVTNGVQM